MLSEQIGQLLKEARLEKELSEEEVSRAISLRVSLIQALEEGDFDQTGALVYTKAYLRRYARFVELNDDSFEELVSQLKERDDLYEDIGKSAIAKAERERSSVNRSFRIYLAAVILLCGIGFFAAQQGWIPFLSEESEKEFQDEYDDDGFVPRYQEGYFDDGLSEEIELSPEVLASLIDEEYLEGLNLPEVESNEREESLLLESKRAEEMISQQRAEESTEREDNSNASVVTEENRGVKLHLKANCWTKITDSSGKELVAKELTSGEYLFDGTAPFRIRIGNAQALEAVEIDGVSIEEKQFRPDNRTSVHTFTVTREDVERE